MNTAVFPPLFAPFRTYKFSLSFSTSMTLGACCPPAWGAAPWRATTTTDSAPIPTSTPKTMLLLIPSSIEWGDYSCPLKRRLQIVRGVRIDDGMGWAYSRLLRRGRLKTGKCRFAAAPAKADAYARSTTCRHQL